MDAARTCAIVFCKGVVDISIGYACVTLGVPWPGQRGCMMKNASAAVLEELIRHNLGSLENALRYNIDNGIMLYRISSDIIPFGSSPVNMLPWREMFAGRLRDIGEIIKESGMRVSMHPGQYTALNSPDDKVARRAAQDLEYHSDFLCSLGLDKSHKIILHGGGAYGDKKSALDRFAARFDGLPPLVASRIALENDDRIFNIRDILSIAGRLGLPVVYDNLHNLLNPAFPDGHPEDRPGSHTEMEADDLYWIRECASTWKNGRNTESKTGSDTRCSMSGRIICGVIGSGNSTDSSGDSMEDSGDGCQKIHYSQQDISRKRGSHSDSIDAGLFLSFYRALAGQRGNKDGMPDIMLEVKDKNISALKCINCAATRPDLRKLEAEWGRYKYRVLEKSQAAYSGIRSLFGNGKPFEALDFYKLAEEAEKTASSLGSAENAALHVWGYFKDICDEKEKAAFFGRLDSWSSGRGSIGPVKNHLWKLALKYKIEYLLYSYYFI